MTEVRTRDEAISLVDHALQTWSTNLSGVLGLAHATSRAACGEAERTVRQRASEVAAIQAILASTESGKRRALEAKLVHAKEASAQAERAQMQINDVASGVAQLYRTHITTTATQVGIARAQLSGMSRALENYRSVRASFDDGGSGGSAARSHTGGGGETGLSDLDVNAADLDENPILDDGGFKGGFGKGGLSRADYRWAVQSWNDTVGPGMSNGKTRDDFVARDEQSNAQPLRRTADVFDMFLGSDRIRAERRSDGSLNIINGRHRLLIAQELGIKTLPGEIR